MSKKKDKILQYILSNQDKIEYMEANTAYDGFVITYKFNLPITPRHNLMFVGMSEWQLTIEFRLDGFGNTFIFVGGICMGKVVTYTNLCTQVYYTLKEIYDTTMENRKEIEGMRDTGRLDRILELIKQ